VLLAAAVGSARNVALGTRKEPADLSPRRALLLERLGTEPGRHVVLVRYGPAHSVHEEWVYNGADIDGSRIVFAHERSPAENAALFAWYPERRFWLLSPDDGDRLDRLEAASLSPSPAAGAIRPATPVRSSAGETRR
jgi:hypothetical protein